MNGASGVRFESNSFVLFNVFVWIGFYCGEQEMASREGFLTEEQREMLKIASQNAEVMSSLSLASSPKSSGPKSPGQNSSLLFEHHHVKAPAGGHSAAGGGVAVRHVRRSHSGKLVRVKKGMYSVSLFFMYFVFSCRLVCW